MNIVILLVIAQVTCFKLSSHKDVEVRIDLHLIKKTWYPKEIVPPKGDQVLDEWNGSVEDAHKILSNFEYPVYDSVSFPLEEASVLFSDKYGYDPSLPTIIAIQTMTGTKDSFFTKNTIRTLAMRNMVKRNNVFNLRFPQLQPSIKLTVIQSYLGWCGNYNVVSEAIGSVLMEAIQRNVLKANQINLIGFSYSSQLSGYIGRYIYAKTGQKIQSIMGLDPYALGRWEKGVTHLSRDDANIVHVIHTNSFMWGTREHRATADFIINNGNIQPGCTEKFFGFLPCSHARAAPILWYMMLFKSKFQATSCPNYWKFWQCKCDRNPIVTMTYPLKKEPIGTYYLWTSKVYPFGEGEGGIVCKRKTKKKNNKTKISKKNENKGFVKMFSK